MNNEARIDAATQSLVGSNANVNLTIADSIILQNNSTISAEAFGEANGGNLKIDTNFIIAFPQGSNDIIANAQQGKGGEIKIDAISLFGIKKRSLNPSTNDIDASSDLIGLDGNIVINSLNADRIQETKELSSSIFEPEKTVAQACQANRVAAKNSLILQGRGGMPPAPNFPLDSHLIIDSDNTDSVSAIPEPIETSHGKIQPARGVKITKSGDVILTAYRTSNAGDRLTAIKSNCN